MVAGVGVPPPSRRVDRTSPVRHVPVTDALKRVDARILRAEVHRHAFQKRADALRDFTRENLVRRLNADGSEHSYDLRLPQWDMDQFSLMASDVLHNARSALDNLAYRLAELNQERVGATIPEEQQDAVYFPICLKSQHFRSEEGSALALLSKDAKNLIRRYQPYSRSDPPEEAPFWGLRKLQDVDKHRFLVRLGFEFGGLVADAPPGYEILMRPGEAMTATNGPQDRMHFCTFTVDPPNLDLDLKPDPAIFVSFDKGPWDRRHVALILYRLLCEIADLYREARELSECAGT